MQVTFANNRLFEQNSPTILTLGFALMSNFVKITETTPKTLHQPQNNTYLSKHMFHNKINQGSQIKERLTLFHIFDDPMKTANPVTRMKSAVLLPLPTLSWFPTVSVALIYQFLVPRSLKSGHECMLSFLKEMKLLIKQAGFLSFCSKFYSNRS